MSAKALAIFAFFLLCSFGQSFAQADEFCAKITSSFSHQDKKVIACEDVDFGAAQISDYHPPATGAMTQNVSEIKNTSGEQEYLKELKNYYGIRNMKFFATCNGQQCPVSATNPNATGISLLAKFATAIQAEFPADKSLLNYVSGQLALENKANPSVNSAEGFCLVMTAKSMDPTIIKWMDDINEGIFCNGVGFPKSELKELILAVYPDPFLKVDQVNDVHMLSDYVNPQNPNLGIPKNEVGSQMVEDSNIALAKLGKFASNSQLTPDMLLSLAKAASTPQADGSTERLAMNLDPGSLDVWNQPIEKVVDVSYLDEQMQKEDLYEALSGQDLEGSSPEAATIKNKILFAEAGLTDQARQLQTFKNQALTDLEQIAGAPISNASPKITDQVDQLKKIQAQLISENRVGVKQNVVVKHSIFIRYGDEVTFGSPLMENHKYRQLDFISVNGRSTWLPPTEKLSAACKSGAAPKHRVEKGSSLNPYGLSEYLGQEQFEKACKDLGEGRRPDQDLLAGPFPPQNLTVLHYKESPQFDPVKEANKKKAFEALDYMIHHCDDTHRGAFGEAKQFMDDVHSAVQTNALSPATVNSLAARYQQLKEYLDEGEALKSDIEAPIIEAGGNPQAVPGLNALYSKIFQ